MTVTTGLLRLGQGLVSLLELLADGDILRAFRLARAALNTLVRGLALLGRTGDKSAIFPAGVVPEAINAGPVV